MMRSRLLVLGSRVFAMLHWLLPAPYRRRYADEARITFERLARDAVERGGRLVLVHTIVSACADLLRRVPVEHAASRRRRRASVLNDDQPIHVRGPARRLELAMRNAGEDVRYAVRKVGREPGFFALAAMIIGLGVGANAAVFSVMSPLLIRPLPFRDADRLVWVARMAEGGMSAITSRTANLRDYRTMSRAFESLTGYMAFFDYGSYTLVGAGEPERLVGVGIAQDFLDVLGVAPALGRGFVDEEAVWGGRPAAILTHEYWTRRFDADPGIVGQSITLNNQPTEVVGVMPASFDFASTFTPASRIDFLMPYPISDETDRWGNTLAIIGRLRPGVTVAAAQADLDRVTELLSRDDPDRWGLGAVVTGLREHIAGEHRPAMMLLIAAASAVLLVACANLSSLLLARGRSRNREMAVRSALGAGRYRLIRQLSIESMVLVIPGGAIGVFLAWAMTGAIAGSSAISIPLLRTVGVDVIALAFALAVTLIAGFLVGLAPALQAVAGHEAQAMRESGRSSTEGRRGALIRETLVVGEVAAACVLLVGSSLLMRSFVRVLEVDPGFEPSGVVAWRVDTTRQFDNVEAASAFYDGLATRVEALPGVEAVGLTDTPPLGRNREWPIRGNGVEYPENRAPSAFPRLVDGDYLQTMRIPLRAGRYFTPFDNAGTDNVIIINETAVAAVFRGGDPLGRTVMISGTAMEVIGVVGDVRHQSLERQSGNEMYLLAGQVSGGFSALTMVVRSSAPLPTLARNVAAAIRDVDASMPADDFETLDSVVDRAVSPRRFVLTILGGFAGTALLLAALGIYAVLSYVVSQQTPEIGIRMALGESAAQVRRRIVGRTLFLAGTGIAIGAVASIALSRAIRSMLFGVGPTDPLSFAAMAAVLLLVALMAGFLPARRASSTDPVAALRSG